MRFGTIILGFLLILLSTPHFGERLVAWRR